MTMRNGSSSIWMLTSRGKAFSIGRPSADDVSLGDIAHHLAQINRFCGACFRPYSVAEHSLLVAEICERELRMPRIAVLAALMHDAHEAYLGDIINPVKHYLGDTAHAVESSLERAVQLRYGLRTAAHSYRHEIRSADLRALATERRDLLPPHPGHWSILTGIEPAAWVNLGDSGRCDLSWQDWRTAFVDKFNELNYERTVEHIEQHGAAARLPE